MRASLPDRHTLINAHPRVQPHARAGLAEHARTRLISGGGARLWTTSVDGRAIQPRCEGGRCRRGARPTWRQRDLRASSARSISGARHPEALTEGRIRPGRERGLRATGSAVRADRRPELRAGWSRTSARPSTGECEVLVNPSLPHVTLVPRDRLRRRTGQACLLHWADVPVDGEVTTPIQTVLDCLRALPLAEGLAIADSALRQQLVRPRRAAGSRRQAAADHIGAASSNWWPLADGRSESVLESALRAILIEAGIDGFVPQVPFGTSASPPGSISATRSADRAGGRRLRAPRHPRRRWSRTAVDTSTLTIRGWPLLRFAGRTSCTTRAGWLRPSGR